MRCYFKKVDKVKSSPIYRDIMNRLELLGDRNKKLSLQATSILAISIPIIIIISFIFSNIKIGQEIAIKQGIHDYIIKYKDKKRLLTNIKRDIATSYVLKSSNDFIKKVQESASDHNKIKISNFSKRNLYSMTKSTATLSFKDISTKELMSLIGILTSRDKIKVSKINISKK